MARTQAISRTPTVPIALSLAPGESIQLCESLWARTRMISSGRERPFSRRRDCRPCTRDLRAWAESTGLASVCWYPGEMPALERPRDRRDSPTTPVFRRGSRRLRTACSSRGRAGEVQLAIGQRILREIEQVFRHPLASTWRIKLRIRVSNLLFQTFSRTGFCAQLCRSSRIDTDQQTDRECQEQVHRSDLRISHGVFCQEDLGLMFARRAFSGTDDYTSKRLCSSPFTRQTMNFIDIRRPCISSTGVPGRPPPTVYVAEAENLALGSQREL